MVKCDVCLESEGEKASSIAPLVLKHLGLTAQKDIVACQHCSRLLNLWDEFSSRAKSNFKISHPGCDTQWMEERMDQDQDDNQSVLVIEKVEHCTPELLAELSETECGSLASYTTASNHEQDMPDLKPMWNVPLQNGTDTLPVETPPLHTCIHCGKKFTRKQNLILHKQSAHQIEDNKLSCPFCPGRLTTQFQMNQHIKFCHSEVKTQPKNYSIPSEFVCDICGLDLKTCERFDHHMVSKHGTEYDKIKNANRILTRQDSSQKYFCKLCPKVTGSKMNLQLHMTKCHSSSTNQMNTGIPKNYKCKVCFKTFAARPHLLTHYRHYPDHGVSIDTDKKYKFRDGLYFCNYCLKSCHSEYFIQKHIKEFHTSLPAKLDVPTKPVPINGDHQNESKNDQIHENGTGKKETEKDVIKVKLFSDDHFTMKRNNNFSCNFCGKLLSTYTSIDLHILRHIQVDGTVNQKNIYFRKSKEGSHECTLCDKKVLTEVGILYHLRNTHAL